MNGSGKIIGACQEAEAVCFPAAVVYRNKQGV